jgi:hypothetical protein
MQKATLLSTWIRGIEAARYRAVIKARALLSDYLDPAGWNVKPFRHARSP